MSKLREHVVESIRTRELMSAREKILVAVSGGVDSMVLLDVLHKSARKNQWRLVVAHLNHQLRGKNSDADERLVVSIAKKLKIPIVVERADVKAIAGSGKLSVEMAARKVRHEFLARTAARLKIRRIALAHHADDQVELFFLRLLRGAGPDGLAGMKWQGPSPANPAVQLVRPLLGQSKNALLDYAAAEMIPFREDASNESLDFRRNRIRQELLPLLRRHYQSALDRVIGRLMEILRAESDFLDESARGESNATLKFDQLHRAIQRRQLQAQMVEQGIPADFELIERLRNSADATFTIAPNFTILRDPDGRIHLRAGEAVIPKSNEMEVALSGATGSVRFAGKHFDWRMIAKRAVALPPRRTQREWFDAEKIGTHILLRHWRPGDRFQPIGMKKPIKLQDIFINQKIPRSARHQLIIATTSGGEIFWVEGLRIGELCKLTAKTRKRLEWRWDAERI